LQIIEDASKRASFGSKKSRHIPEVTMARQISVFLSYLILGMFFSVGILRAEESNSSAADNGAVPAVTAAETENLSNAESDPDTAAQGISVKDLETTQSGKDQESAVMTENSPTKKHFETESMIVTKDWFSDGKVIGDKEKKLIISEGDTVYVNIGSDKVNKGDICMIFRKIGKVKDPDNSDKVLGYEVRRIGKIEIIDTANPKAASAKVVVSYEPIGVGDLIKIGQSE
jgi:hypothetical protein